RLARRAEVRALERIHRDVDLRIVRHLPPDLFADEQHGRLVALAFADHDRAAHRQRVHRLPHRLHGDLIRIPALALAHRSGTGDRRLFYDSQKLAGQMLLDRHRKPPKAGVEVARSERDGSYARTLSVSYKPYAAEAAMRPGRRPSATVERRRPF